MNTNEIVKNLRLSKGYKQKDVASFLEIPYTTYNNYESGRRKIGSFMLMQIAQLYGVSIDYLLGIDTAANSPAKEAVPPPRQEDSTEEILVLEMQDNSMEPRIFRGDHVVIKKQKDVESGEIAAVKVNGEPPIIKKIMKHPQGYLAVSLNAGAYPPALYTLEDMEIVGKAIEIRGSLDQWD